MDLRNATTAKNRFLISRHSDGVHRVSASQPRPRWRGQLSCRCLPDRVVSDRWPALSERFVLIHRRLHPGESNARELGPDSDGPLATLALFGPLIAVPGLRPRNAQ